jgi:RNA polymerase sigma-70 factor (ECF subfamily)
MDPREQEIINACQRGDMEVFAELYDRYVEKIYNFIFFKTFHRETAQDLTSETFFKAIRSLDSFDPTRPFAPWLYRIAHNTVIDYFRTRKETVDIDDMWDIGEESTVEATLDTEIDFAAVKKHLAHLSDEQREIVIMRVWDEMPYRDIAEVIGKSEANCKMIFSRALSKLRTLATAVAALLILIR